MPIEKITTTPAHTKQTFSYGASFALQKLSYYGWRSILFLLFMDQAKKSDTELVDLLFWLGLFLSIAYLLGGVLGDLLIGNKRTAIIGAGIMIIGSLLFVFDPTINPYTPIALFAIGCGLYQSNVKAIFAKLYLRDVRLLDSGFLILYFFTNIGSFVGTLFVVQIAEAYGIEYGFLVVGASTALSLAMLLLTKQAGTLSDELLPAHKSVFNAINLKPVAIILSLFALYCIAWELSYNDVFVLYWKIGSETRFTDSYWIYILELIFDLIVSVFLIILWSKKYYDPITKLMISAILTLLAFGVPYLFYQQDWLTTSAITIAALFAYTIATLLIAPFIDATIAKLIHRKFLAIAYGSTGLIAMGIGYVFLRMEEGINLLTEQSILVGFGGLILLSIILLIRKYRSQ